jgi:hydrogenase expression/formation protein HypC
MVRAMCISYPCRVLSVDGDSAVVQQDQRRLRAMLHLVEDVKPGEWVVVAAGTVIERLADEEATELLALHEMAAAQDRMEAT